MMESLAKHMANIMKKGGPEAAKAMKKIERPTYECPTEVTNGTRKDKLKFDFEYQLYMEKQDNWEEIPGRIFEKLCSYCAPNKKTKLRGMPGWEAIGNDQDLRGGIRCGSLLVEEMTVAGS